MNNYDMTSRLYHDDHMTYRASSEAEDRFRVRGEIMWSRKSGGFEIPLHGDIIRSTKYEFAAFRDDGELFHVNAFVVTGFATVALIRLMESAVRVTVWGHDRDSVGETVRAFLAVWPRQGTGTVTELMAGQYV